MSTRYVTNAVAALLGGTLVVLSMGLPSATAVRWSAFGIAIAIAAVAGLAQFGSRRGLTQRALDGALVMVAGSLIGVTYAYAGSTLVWAVFALALASAGVAFSGLTLHEVESWRELHGLGELHWLHPQAKVAAVGSGTPSGRAA